MLCIYSLKNTISIQEIKKVLQPYHESTDKIEPIYNQFLELNKYLSHELTNAIQSFVEQKQYDLNDQDQITIMLLLICALSDQFKSIAEKMLDTFYPEPKEK